MQLQYKPNLDEAKQYWRAFWEKEVIDRPAVCVTAPKRGCEAHKPYGITPVMNYFACMNDEWDEHLPKIETTMENTWFGGEAMPWVEITLGPDVYGAFLGAKLEARRSELTTWSKPIWEGDISEFHAELDHSPTGAFEMVRRAYRKLADWSENKCLLGMLDYHSQLDALCALRDPMDVCMDIFDDPDNLSRVLDEIAATYVPIFEALYEDGRMEQRGSTGWIPHYLEKGRLAVVSCDYSCMLSPEQGRRFFLPYVRQEVEHLDRAVYHLDGKGSLQHLDELLAIPGIDCIQWVPGDGQPRTIEWMDLLKKIQAAGKSVWIYDWTPDEIRARFRELDPARTLFTLRCQTQDEGEQLLQDLRL